MSSSHQRIAEILLPVALDSTFAYTLDTEAEIGQRVVVNFGSSGEVVGLIVAITSEDSEERTYELKPVIRVLDNFPVVNDAWWRLMFFAAKYYAEPLGKAMKNAFPAKLRNAEALSRPTEVTLIITEQGQECLVADELPGNATKQRKLLSLLSDKSPISYNELRQHGLSKTEVSKALDKNWLTSDKRSPHHDDSHIKTAPYPLNDEQVDVLERISQDEGRFAGHLIEGVTGSGKTELYMQLIEKALTNGGQVLLLVPEIGLTPQMLARFRDRFGKRVATYHSGMTDNQRRDVFLSSMMGDLPILIGTRSAIFVPMKQLSLILIDEEHDLSYKQHDGFLYNARDLAQFRAQQAGINVVMGSATPSFESLHNVSTGKLQLHYLKQRASNVSMPSIRIVDRRGHSREQVLADSVQQQMRQALQRGEQVLLFLNRRGFSPVMGCGNCDWRSDCPACSVFQTAHIRNRQLCCHHCGHAEPLPLHCPKCGDSDVFFVGAGTEKLESQLQQQFPRQRIMRLDRDVQTTAKQLDEALERVHAGDVDIIVGTQLVVKGHHFPKVTTVVIVDADSALFSSDFRAEERLYQQLIQVAGRAGRETQGRVFVQSSVPEHPVFKALLQHDYHRYAQELLAERKLFALPPFSASATIKACAVDQELSLNYLRAVKTALRENCDTIDVFGPVPLAVAKVNHRYHAHITLTAPDKRALQKVLPLLQKIIQHFDRTNRFKTIIDVDALS